jgi:hypothetical protein
VMTLGFINRFDLGVPPYIRNLAKLRKTMADQKTLVDTKPWRVASQKLRSGVPSTFDSSSSPCLQSPSRNHFIDYSRLILTSFPFEKNLFTYDTSV